MIQFLLDNKIVNIAHERADTTVLQYLRDQQALTGTKEGCAAGDCGACTVVIAEQAPPSHEVQDESSPILRYKAINSCVTFLSALHGKQLITVEHLSDGKILHPVQQAMVDQHGSQCGFCTPGFVMSMFALYKKNINIERNDAINALSGNLCRCTGYRPIIDATMQACNKPTADKFTDASLHTAAQLAEIKSDNQGTDTLIMPQTRQALAQAMLEHKGARLVAGSTDLALVHTQQLQAINKMISITGIAALKRLECDVNLLTIGAACTLSEIQGTLLEHFPSLQEVMERFASVPIRNQATIGGNVANASPIGDMPPILIALNAQLVLDNGARYRSVAIQDFFTGYKQTQLLENEWVDSIQIALPSPNQILRVYKVSKRIEDDISAVCMALNITLENNTVRALSTGFGGVAATPSSCTELSEALIGKDWSNANVIAIGKPILSNAFTPIDDVRASGDYRKQLLENLWHRFWLESNANSSSIETRVSLHA